MIVLYIVRYRLVLFDVLYIDLGGYMSLADTQYLGIIENILEHGTYGQNRTGVATYKLPHQIMQFDLQEEFPILTTKFVAFKTAVKELLWIWQMQSNDVRKLQEMNVRVWDEWMREVRPMVTKLQSTNNLIISSRLSRKILIAVV